MSKTNIPQEVRSIAGEVTDHHNDGWVIEHYKQKLLDIKVFIEQILEDPKSPTKLTWEFKKY